MIPDFNKTKKLIIGILIAIIILEICIGLDSAEETESIEIAQNISNIHNETIKTNETYIGPEHSGKAITDGKLYNDKPTVTMWAKPSVRSNYAYKWYKKTFIDYCPHCNRYNVLYNAHKYAARYEQEWTCSRCGADYCAVTGKEKYSWSNYYLIEV